MSCNCAAIMDEIVEIKAMLADLHQARNHDDLTGQPFTIPARDSDRRTAALADFAAKQNKKRLRQRGN